MKPAAQACVVEVHRALTQILSLSGGDCSGHPIRASGCRILVTLVHEMMKRCAKTGLAISIGGGMGTASSLNVSY